MTQSPNSRAVRRLCVSGVLGALALALSYLESLSPADSPAGGEAGLGQPVRAAGAVPVFLALGGAGPGGQGAAEQPAVWPASGPCPTRFAAAASRCWSWPPQALQGPFARRGFHRGRGGPMALARCSGRLAHRHAAAAHVCHALDVGGLLHRRRPRLVRVVVRAQAAPLCLRARGAG